MKRPVCGVCQRPCPKCKEYHENIRRQNPSLYRRIEDADKETPGPGNLYSAWWQAQQDMIKIRGEVFGFELDESPTALYERLEAVWKIVEPYTGETK